MILGKDQSPSSYYGVMIFVKKVMSLKAVNGVYKPSETGVQIFISPFIDAYYSFLKISSWDSAASHSNGISILSCIIFFQHQYANERSMISLFLCTVF